MSPNFLRSPLSKTANRRVLPSALLLSLLPFTSALAQNFTQLDLNNPVPGQVTENGGNISITAGGGDTYGTEDSFTYLYEQRTGDFDIKVQVTGVDADDAGGAQKSAKAALHIRATLDKNSPDIQVNATPLNGAGYVETIARPLPGGETEDPPENTPEFLSYGGPWPGTYKPNGALSYPLWLRVRREGNLFQTMASQDAVAWSVLAEYSMDSSSFPPAVYVGLAAVAHSSASQDTGLRVRAGFSGYSDVPTTPVTNQGANVPGTFPNATVTGINWNVSVPANGIGFTADKTQSGQIVWPGSDFNSLSRDIILDIGGQGPVPFSTGRYALGALDFGISPSNTVAASANLGTGASRDRSTPDAFEAPAQAWFPSPRHGVLLPVLRKNGPIQWNDGAPSFYPHVYQAIDFSSAKYFSMDNGTYGNGQMYTRMAKKGNAAQPLANSGVYQRSAVDISVAWFPYSQGWKAGSFEDASNGGKAYWQYPASHSAAATENTFVLTSNPRNTAEAVLSWIDPGGAGLAELGFPDVNAQTSGMIFLAPNNDGSGTIRGPQANCAIKADGSGWTVAIRDVEANKFDVTSYAQAAASEFSFVYVPYTAGNLIGGHISAAGEKTNAAGDFTISRTATGQYLVSIPGKTANSGMLILQPVGLLPNNPNVVDRATLSYEPAGDGNGFVIESRGMSAGTGAGGLDEFPLQDSDFYFAWVDFTNPLTPVATTPEVPPVLDIVRGEGNTVTVSWPAAVTGYVLESSTTLSAPWTVVPGVINNTVTLTVPAESPKLFFHLKKL